uniref:Uncharacterized protein n=1 Tax=Anguilla anguilla TaxID=7936 RepID=A0A0E9SNU1_ANGAN
MIQRGKLVALRRGTDSFHSGFGRH